MANNSPIEYIYIILLYKEFYPNKFINKSDYYKNLIHKRYYETKNECTHACAEYGKKYYFLFADIQPADQPNTKQIMFFYTIKKFDIEAYKKKC